jgi:hypothetical protein
MRTSMAYFAGAGTIVVAIAAGLGGGLTIANMVNPHQQKFEQTRLEQRMSAKPIQPAAEADQSKAQASNTSADKPQADQPKVPVPYLAATQAASAPVVVAPAPQTQAAAPAPQSSQPSPQPVEAKLVNDAPAEPQTAKPQAAPRDQASSSPDDANARARESDLKRLAAEKRKAERRQQWADRKKAQQQREVELRDADVIVRRDTDGPRIVAQDDDDSGRRGNRVDSDRRGNADRPLVFFNLFGGDRD